MRLSQLQKFILLKCFDSKNCLEKKVTFYDFYTLEDYAKKKNSIQIRVHSSLENMVEKDWAIAYGRRTTRKFYIDKIRLTAKGKKKAKELVMEKQSKLPIK